MEWREKIVFKNWILTSDVKMPKDHSGILKFQVTSHVLWVYMKPLTWTPQHFTGEYNKHTSNQNIKE